MSLVYAQHAHEPIADDLPRGETLPRTVASAFELPPVDTKRWVVRRKAALVAAVRNGVIDLQEACRRYRLSEEEFRAWERGIAAHGVASLQISRLQVYRSSLLLRRVKPR